MVGELAVLTPIDGDLKVIWDSDKPAEVSAARKTFDDMKAQGYLAYRAEKGGERGEVIKHFDPAAERIIMAPRMVGG